MEGVVLEGRDMPDKAYTLAGRKGFVHRFIDTGFKTKWCGAWFPPLKFFEYFAFNINGEWLSPNNIAQFCLNKGRATHVFKLSGLDVSEELFVPKNLSAAVSVLGIKNTTGEKKKIIISLEAAVNIRTKAENIHQRGYTSSFSEVRKAVSVRSGSNCAVFGMGKIPEASKQEFKRNEAYKEHSPGGILQRCFLPGSYTMSIELDAGKSIKIPFIFSGSCNAKDEFADFDACFTGWKTFVSLQNSKVGENSQKITTPDRAINDAYSASIANMQSFIHDSAFGTGMFAGFPWFLEFWGRDTFWSIKGLIDAGAYDEARQIIRTLAAFQKNRMPCTLNLDRTAYYHGADVDALFLIALDYYTALSGDADLEKELEANVKSSLDSLVLLDYLVQHKPEETWMDSIPRQQTAVEIQSFWIEALRKRAPELAKKMHEKLIESFWNADEKYLNDTADEEIHSAKKTSNALFPLVFGQIAVRDALQILDTAKSGLASPFGVRTLSAYDKTYSPSAYHDGAAWGFTTAIAACAALNYGRVGDGIGYLKILADDAKKNLGAMSECLNSQTGELLGCGMQLWSSALFVHAIDMYLFGISHNSSERKIVIAPLIPPEWKHMERRGKIAGNNSFDLSVMRTKKGYEMEINFRSAPEGMKAVVFVPEGVKGALVNSKKTKPAGEQSIEFVPGKVNTIAIEVLRN